MRFKKKRHYRKRSKLDFKLKKQTIYTVGAIWLWIFAGAITLSFFAEGVLLSRIREELTFQMGFTHYLLPPFLVVLSFLFFKVKSDIGKPNVPMGYGILLVALTAITQNGLIGETLWNTVVSAISIEGAVLVYVGCIIIGLMILCNTSLDRLINFILVGVQGIFG